MRRQDRFAGLPRRSDGGDGTQDPAEGRGDVGWKPVALMVAETAFLAMLFLAALAFGWL